MFYRQNNGLEACSTRFLGSILYFSSKINFTLMDHKLQYIYAEIYRTFFSQMLPKIATLTHFQRLPASFLNFQFERGSLITKKSIYHAQFVFFVLMYLFSKKSSEKYVSFFQETMICTYFTYIFVGEICLERQFFVFQFITRELNIKTIYPWLASSKQHSNFKTVFFVFYSDFSRNIQSITCPLPIFHKIYLNTIKTIISTYFHELRKYIFYDSKT